MATHGLPAWPWTGTLAEALYYSGTSLTTVAPCLSAGDSAAPLEPGGVLLASDGWTVCCAEAVGAGVEAAGRAEPGEEGATTSANK